MESTQPDPEAADGDTDLDQLVLEYENETGNHRVTRTYTNHGTFVREVDIEEGYSYPDEEWQVVTRFTRDYALAADGETLKGDGSNWKGTGRNWRNYFREWNQHRLSLRFPHDDLTGSEFN